MYAIAQRKKEELKKSAQESVSSDALLKEFEADELAANAKYKNKRVIINTKVVRYITQEGSSYVELKMDNPNVIYCYYDNLFDLSGELYIKDRRADVYGEYKEVRKTADQMNPVFQNCHVVNWGIDISTPPKPGLTQRGRV